MEEKDIAIIIDCDLTPSNNWMAYASWYSIHKHIADAQVYLGLEKLNITKYFRWCNSVGVKVFRNQFYIKTPIVKRIAPTVLAVRDFDGNLNISSSKSDVFSTLVDYKFGCGDFVLDKWINSEKAPFEDALKKFSNYNLSINEKAILEIWEQCLVSYRALGGFV